jgi:outer membrane protein assembly factor BamB
VIGNDGNLFVGTAAFTGFTGDTVNYFYSMDKNGENNWTFLTDNPWANVAGPTITDDGTIYFSSIGGGLYALNPDGTLKWNNKKFTYTYFTRYIPVGKNHNLYLHWIDTLFVVEPENGNIIDSIYTPKISDTEVVFSTGGDTIFYFSGLIQTPDPKALNAITLQGEYLWSIELYNYTHSWGTPLVDNANRIYFYATDNLSEQFLCCVNPNGTISWKYPLENAGYQNYSSPTMDRNGNVIFQTNTDDTGYINSIDYYGNFNWKVSLGDIYNGAIIDHGLVCDAAGKIYCGSTSGLQTYFWCIDSDGKILWKLDLEGYEYNTSPAIGSDGTLYIGTHLSSTFQNHIRNFIVIRDTVTSVENNDKEILSYSLEQNYPNPFNSLTHIRYTISRSGNVSLKVFDMLGNEVANLVDKYQSAGYYEVLFEENDLSSGIYFYQFNSGGFIGTKNMILLK